MADEKKCAWYAEYEGVCTNGDCPYCIEWCPISGELSICRFDSSVAVHKKPNGNRTKNRYNGSIAVVSISPDGTVTHYPSIKEAAKAIGTSTSFISQAVNFGKQCRGMMWKKAGEYDG